MCFQQYIAFTIPVPCILSMWPSQLSLCARIKFIMFLCFIISSSSWIVFIRHIPFSFFGPNIFLRIFLSNTDSLLISLTYKNMFHSHAPRRRYQNNKVHMSLQNFGSSVWNLLHVILLAPRISGWFLDSCKICGLLW
jgi:hypothetical protein